MGVAPLLVNHARYEALPGELQRVLAEASAESVAVQRRLAVAEDEACLRLLAKAGVAVLGPDAIDMRGFAAAVGGALI